MKKIEFLLIQLEGFLYSTYPELLNYFYEPISVPTNVAEESILKLYEWRDGSKINMIEEIGLFQFCSFGYFLSFRDGLSFKNQFNLDGVFNNKNYFPIIASLGGDFLLVDLSKKRSKVYLYSPNLLINNPIEIFSTVENFIETVYECFLKVGYNYDSQFYLEIDNEIEREIALKINPKIEYWKN
jgi:hypothetical protein